MLKSMGITINDDDYCSMILQALPWSLANFTSMQLTAAQLYPSLSGGTIKPDRLINMICNEWEWIHSHPSEGCAKESESMGDDTMGVEAEGQSKWKGKGRGKGKAKGLCYNCGRLHWKQECTEPKKKEGDKPQSLQAATSAHAVIDDDDISFAVEVEEVDEDEDNWQVPGNV
ncbi:hypothetical protein P691DRAFT_759338 [Macrolepiota fuliginosa MF-IS2]|uniref:CCHC-type domain-containing protein n=1 Tax=Macrolepiota fuliginosa MF-IS2 TaxID=1400762 RepID=A0A9P6C4R7_9AGAR|nr:hypothetical protein P691DRAFT_759338 [Macrolepiota fuliginosa MF-IS2]